MSDKTSNDLFLDALFTDARAQASEPSADLMARVLGDAEAVQPLPASLAPSMAGPRIGFWQQLTAQIGGWPAMAGLASAAVVGLWIGASPTTSVSDSFANLLGAADSAELFTPSEGFDFWQFEG